MKALRHSVALAAAAQGGQDKPSKYRNERVTVNGVKLDSKAEGRRYQELLLLERAGEISELRLQVPFELAPGVRFAGAARSSQPLRYFADFVYRVRSGALVVEDVKGMVTDAFRIKRHLMKAVHNIDIKLLRAAQK